MDNIHKIFPLIIKSRKGVILDVSLSNEKGFNKSLERGSLWHLHQGTGRLLPYSEENLLSITAHKSWHEAILNTADASDTPGAGSQGADYSLDLDFSPPDASAYPEELDGIDPTHSQNTGADNADILKILQQVVIQRKRQMPEGSYTTHLFESGAEKIRKKAGEEAIELILASGREEIIYESADLIYHMLVLLVSEGISIEEVLTELGKRATSG